MGLFDELFQGMAQVITELFVNTPATFIRLKDEYDPKSGVSVSVELDRVEALITPPFPFDIKQVDGESVMSQDLQAIVPALELLKDDGTTFDPIPTTEVSISVETRGRSYRAARVEVFSGGDEDAMYGLQLRL